MSQAAILGSVELRDCLVNFAQSFKYTTGLSLRSVADFDWISTFERRTQTIAQLAKHHSFQSGKEHVGTETIVCT
jgi:8-amino-7-oxononanoate synthase